MLTALAFWDRNLPHLPVRPPPYCVTQAGPQQHPAGLPLQGFGGPILAQGWECTGLSVGSRANSSCTPQQAGWLCRQLAACNIAS